MAHVFVVKQQNNNPLLIIFYVNTQKLVTVNHGYKRHYNRHNIAIVSTRQWLVLTLSTLTKWLLTIFY